MAQRADLVEIDIRQTNDGVLVAMHDATLTRTTDADLRFPERDPWRVGDFHHADVTGLDAGTWLDPGFAGVGVPTLADVLDALDGTDVGLLLEVKAPRSYPGIGDRLVAELTARKRWRDRLTLESFDHGFVREFAERLPGHRVGVLGTPDPGELPDLAGYADLVNPQYGTFDEDYLGQVHRCGMRAFVWTVDDPDEMSEVIAMGADGVISNRPDVLRDVAAGTSA